MEIIRYFCIVKRLDYIFRLLCLSVFIFLTAASKAQGSRLSMLQQMDSVEIGLLTCSPGNEIWSLYGHTAIRFRDPHNNQDLAINYGMFSFHKRFFVLRFVFGLTDYEMGIVPFPMFLVDYASQGRGVVEQRLNLTREEKMAIAQAIYQNYEPANRVYRYNYFYDNCTTRARNILVNHLNGKVQYSVNPSVTSSYRKMTHQWNEYHRWARFGNDLLLGVKADAPTDYIAQQFLPDSLREDFAHAIVIDYNGRKHALVDSTFEVIKINTDNIKSQSSVWDKITPTMVMVALFVLVLLVTIWEKYRRRVYWIVDLVLLTLDGLAGVVLFAMVFSQHPTVSLNLQILILNPLSIIFVYSVAKQQIAGNRHWYWKVLLVCILLFLAGGLLQDYAEGMYFLAFSLLIRVYSNLWNHQANISKGK